MKSRLDRLAKAFARLPRFSPRSIRDWSSGERLKRVAELAGKVIPAGVDVRSPAGLEMLASNAERAGRHGNARRFHQLAQRTRAAWCAAHADTPTQQITDGHT